MILNKKHIFVYPRKTKLQGTGMFAKGFIHSSHYSDLTVLNSVGVQAKLDPTDFHCV